MRIFKIFLFVSFAFTLSLSAGFEQQQRDELMILQTDQEIIIDGILDEWSDVKEIPVDLSPDGQKVKLSTDITVGAKFTYDGENFYAAVEATDDYFEFPSRSWRYGDGLNLTFIDPSEGDESDQFYTFGFSLEGEEKAELLVNRDGEYFPSTSIKDLKLEIKKDELKNLIIYEIAIPWECVIPFKPFIHDRWGINLIYVDRDQGEREILQLYSDENYDTELSNKRKGAIFSFVNHAPTKHEFQASMNASHFYDDSEKIVTLAVNSPSENTGWKIRYEISSAFGNISALKDLALTKGMNRLELALEDKLTESGLYDFSTGIIDDKGTLRYTTSVQYFVLNKKEFEDNNSRINQVKEGELFSQDLIFRESLPTLEIRLEWIKQFMEEAHPFADIQYLNEWYKESTLLFDNIDAKKPALFHPGQISRLAHRSEIDGTLQPYSIFIPDNYDEKIPLPLFVSLHGSGVDEQKFAFFMARTVNFMTFKTKLKKNFIVLAPKARGLSDWYLGDSGKDVIECIQHVKKLYNIDDKNIILDGFSMGGYGAWRIGLLHPDLFKFLIIRSGRISPPPPLEGENVIDLLEKGMKLKIFIVHGEKDNAVPVENARKVVQKLKELGIRHVYIEVKGAAHIGYNKWENIFKWLKNIMGPMR